MLSLDLAKSCARSIAAGRRPGAAGGEGRHACSGCPITITITITISITFTITTTITITITMTTITITITTEALEEPPPSAHRLVKGLLKLKDEGNDAMQRGDPQEATVVYTRALARLDEVRHELACGPAGVESSSLKAT